MKKNFDDIVKKVVSESIKKVINEQTEESRLEMLIAQIEGAQETLQLYFQSNPDAEFDLSSVNNALNNTLNYLRNIMNF